MNANRRELILSEECRHESPLSVLLAFISVHFVAHPMIAPIPSQEATRLLIDWSNGNRDAAAGLMPLVYEELRQRARAYLQREHPDHTLQATALVHEAYLRLVDQRTTTWRNRAHFFGVAAQLMRRILVDHARRHRREKRGGAWTSGVR